MIVYFSGADALDGPRARGAFLMCSLLNPPWSLRIQDEAAPTVLSLIRGGAWITDSAGVPRQLAAGDVAIFHGPDP
ncbi:cupin domain-containing protein [Nocardia sp. 004]|uniref:cupin domain-containing protein n=1 Tax=Nocardia sp. 004 TaxID=3385978 RepID=UPI00399FC7CE